MESTQHSNAFQNQYSTNALIFYTVINPRISSAMMRVLSFYIYIILTTTLSIFKAVICYKEPEPEEDQKVQKTPKPTTRSRQELRKKGMLRKRKGKIKRKKWGLIKAMLKTSTIITVAIKVTKSLREEPIMTRGTGSTWGNKLFQNKSQKLYNLSHDYAHHITNAPSQILDLPPLLFIIAP